jgi:hypothetical protein
MLLLVPLTGPLAALLLLSPVLLLFLVPSAAAAVLASSCMLWMDSTDQGAMLPANGDTSWVAAAAAAAGACTFACHSC